MVCSPAPPTFANVLSKVWVLALFIGCLHLRPSTGDAALRGITSEYVFITPSSRYYPLSSLLNSVLAFRQFHPSTTWLIVYPGGPCTPFFRGLLPFVREICDLRLSEVQVGNDVWEGLKSELPEESHLFLLDETESENSTTPHSFKRSNQVEIPLEVESASLSEFRALIDEMVEKKSRLPSFMKRSEVSFHEYVHILRSLRTFFDPVKPATYLEIGVWKGASSIFMNRNYQPTIVFGIDPFALNGQFKEANRFRELFGADNVTWIRKYSQDAVPDVRQALHKLEKREIDIMLIDGDHSAKRARDDFLLFSPFVAVGGYISFDDYLDVGSSPGVMMAILRMMEDGTFHREGFEVLGTPANHAGASGVRKVVKGKFFPQCSNEFVVRRVKHKA